MFQWNPKKALAAIDAFRRNPPTFKPVYLAYALLLIIVIMMLFAQLASAAEFTI